MQTHINVRETMHIEKIAHEIEYADNIIWYDIAYTVLSVETDFEDGTVKWKVGWPRKLKSDAGPILPDITTHLQRPITVIK